MSSVQIEARRGSLNDALVLSRSVDQVAVTERASSLAKRSIKKSAKVEGLKAIVSMIDLTTLEGKDSPGKVIALCRKAMYPDRSNPDVPHVAAVCVYPTLVSTVAEVVRGSGVRVASVATGFPSGQTWLDIKIEETERAVRDGADEIDMVISRNEFMRGNYQAVFDEIVAVRQACGPAHLKVILETGELESFDQVRKASMIAMFAGADFIKTSTGKAKTNATLPVTLVMLEAIRDFYDETGVQIGMKPAGGISNSKLALAYLVVVNETLGAGWMTPEMFRIGASSLLNDVLMQLDKERTGRYQSSDYYTLD